MSDSSRPDPSSQLPPGRSLDDPGPRRPTRLAGLQRPAIGALAGAAALLGLGQLWARAGGT